MRRRLPNRLLRLRDAIQADRIVLSAEGGHAYWTVIAYWNQERESVLAERVMVLSAHESMKEALYFAERRVRRILLGGG